MNTKLSCSIAATIALSATLGLSACSSDSSKKDGAGSTGTQAQSQQATGQTQNTKPWLVNGKVDITKVDQNSMKGACNTLLGTAEQAVHTAGVDASGKSTADLKNFEWATQPPTFTNGVDKPFVTMTCQPVNYDDQGNPQGSDFPAISISKYQNGQTGPELGPITKDPLFGYGPTDVKTVGNATIYSTTKIAISTKNSDGSETSVPSTGEGSTKDLNEQFSYGNATNGAHMTKDQTIAAWKAGNEQYAKITRPLIEKAAQNVYGG